MSIDNDNPYVGLRPFYAEESLLFFGRDEQTLELLQRLHKHHFVAVVGSSGCGKSSLLRAGLIPSLKGGYLVDDSDQWLIAIMKPGQSPLYNMAESILKQIDSKTKSGKISELVTKIKEEGVDAVLDVISPLRDANQTNFFLLVDQFEELFRFSMEKKNASRKDEAIDFVNIMLELSSQETIPFYVVLTMRSDFIGDCAQFHGLPEAMNKSQYLVPRLNRRQLKMVIEGPARLYGGNFSSALSSKLLNQLGRTQDELPLLQHILMRVWEYELKTDKSGELDIDDYNSVGGLEKALSNHADEAINGMTEVEKGIAKEMFKALTAIDENGRKIRRPLLLSDLQKLTGATDQQLESIIDHFIRDKRSFLILENAGDSGDKVIDISHESLIRQWDTLEEWVDEEAESASYYLQLAEATRLNKLEKKDLLTGSELQIALDWRNKFKPTDVWANRYKEGFEDCNTYLNESDEQNKADVLKEKKRRQAKKISFISIAALIGIVAIIFLYKGRQEMKQNKAFVKFLDATEKISTDPNNALDSMITAINQYNLGKFWDMAIKTYSNNERYEAISQGDTGVSSDLMAFSQDGSGAFIKYGKSQYNLTLRDIKNGNLIDSNIFLNDYLYSIEFISKELGFIGAFEDGSVKYYDNSGKEISEFKNQGIEAISINFNKDLTHPLINYSNGDVILWDLKGNILYKNNIYHQGYTRSTISADENFILGVAIDNNYNAHVSLTNLKSEKTDTLTIKNIKGINNVSGAVAGDDEEDIINAAIFSNNDNILIGTIKGNLFTWNYKSKVIKDYIIQGESVYTVSYSPDYLKILLQTSSGLYIYDINTGKKTLVHQLPEYAYYESRPTFIEDGSSVLISYNAESTGKIEFVNYDLMGKKLSSFNVEYKGDYPRVLISDDKKLVYDITKNNYAFLYDKNGVVKDTIENLLDNGSLEFSSNGNEIINYAYSKIRIFDLAKNSFTDLEGYDYFELNNLSVSPKRDSNKFITNYYGNGDIALWDKKNGIYEHETVFNTYELGSYVNSITISPHEDQLGLVTTKYVESKEGYGKDVYSVSVMNIETNSVSTFKVPDNRTFTSLTFSEDGTYIFGNAGKSFFKWYVYFPDEPPTEFLGNTADVTNIAISPNTNILYSGASDGRILEWNERGEIQNEYKGHNGLSIKGISFYIDSNNKKRMLSGSDDGTVRSWKEGNIVHQYYAGDAISTINFNKDTIITTSAKYSFLYKFDFQAKLLQMLGNNSDKEGIEAFFYPELGYVNLELDTDESTKFYYSNKGDKVLIVEPQSVELHKINKEVINNFKKPDKEWTSVIFSPDDKQFIAVTKEGDLYYYDEKSKAPIHVINNQAKVSNNNQNQGSIPSKEKEIDLVVFSPDGSKVFISKKESPVVYVWDFKNDGLEEFNKLSAPISSLSVSPDNKKLIVGAKNGEAIIYDINQKKTPISVLKMDSDIPVTSVCFSPKEGYVFTGSENGTALLWKFKSDGIEGYLDTKGEVVQRIQNYYAVKASRFNEDGSKLIICSLYDISVADIDPKPTFVEYMQKDPKNVRYQDRKIQK